MDIEKIKESLQTFVLKELLPGEDPEHVAYTTPLVTSGILDSIAMLDFVSDPGGELRHQGRGARNRCGALKYHRSDRGLCPCSDRHGEPELKPGYDETINIL